MRVCEYARKQASKYVQVGYFLLEYVHHEYTMRVLGAASGERSRADQSRR